MLTSVRSTGRSISSFCRFCSQSSQSSRSGDNSVSSSESHRHFEKDVQLSRKRLDIAIVGHPNAGKSTLVNNLCGKHVMPVSSKVHTTRKLMQGFLTEGDTQLIFWDTPGLVTSKQARTHKLPQSIYSDPRRAFVHCDTVALMVDCMDEKHTNKVPQVVKEQLAKLFSTTSVLPDKEVILIINKIDLFKGSQKSMKTLIQVLTSGTIGGKSVESRSTSLRPGTGILSHDFSLSKRKDVSDDSSHDSDVGRLEDLNSYSVASKTEKPSLIDKLDRDDGEYFAQLFALKQRRGFQGFSAVFPLSALCGFGLNELRDYLFSRARPGQFEVDEGVFTDASVEKVIENAIISRVFENLPNHLPYRVTLDIQNIFQTKEHLMVVAVLVTPHQMGVVLGERSMTLRRIVRESQQLIESIVEVPVKLSLTVEERFYVSKRKG